VTMNIPLLPPTGGVLILPSSYLQSPAWLEPQMHTTMPGLLIEMGAC
jgi:hypothetical protein